jgi:hypothetical protein
MHRFGKIWRGWVLLLLAAGVGFHVHAGEAKPTYSVSAVKAAYLVNFVRFTTWPELPRLPEDPIIIGVLSDREIEDFVFRLVAGQRIQGHPVRVRRVVRDDELTQCHLVYLGDIGEEEVRRVVSALGAAPVLTVSAQAGFLDAGGIVAFYSDGSSLRFEINVPALTRSNLVLSSRLLALARPQTPSPAP